MKKEKLIHDPLDVAGFCPDDSHSQGSENPDLSNAFDDVGAKLFRAIDDIANSDGGVNSLIKLISSVGAWFK